MQKKKEKKLPYINFVRCFTFQITNSPCELFLLHLIGVQGEVHVLHLPFMCIDTYWIAANVTVRMAWYMPWESYGVVWWCKGHVEWLTRIFWNNEKILIINNDPIIHMKIKEKVKNIPFKNDFKIVIKKNCHTKQQYRISQYTMVDSF